ncbi:MAG: lamin tail domain-containing protein [Myxococcales bacterium]|nr:lamin tail domain-containing protein [Myxococcales bacterium]
MRQSPALSQRPLCNHEPAQSRSAQPRPALRQLVAVFVAGFAVLLLSSGCSDGSEGEGPGAAVPQDASGDGAGSFDIGGCPANCDDDNPCTDDLCNDGVCSNAANKATCDDGDPCTGGDKCNGGSCKAGANTCTDTTSPDVAEGPKLEPGDLVITEVHYNPYGGGKVSDSNGEWFEIRNDSGDDVDIAGLVIRDDKNDSYTVAGGATQIAKGAYFVFGRSTDKTINGGVEVNHAYGKALNLANSVDALVLESNGTIIDKILWNKSQGWPSLNGKSMQLNDEKSDAKNNDIATAWCASTEEYSSGDSGTPGKKNGLCDAKDKDLDGIADEKDNCPDVPNPTQSDADDNGIGDHCEPDAIPGCGDNVLVETEGCDDGNLYSGDGCSKFCQIELPLPKESLVITEMLPNPATVTDKLGEWIEVYNPTDKDLQINGLRVQVGTDKPFWRAVVSPKPVIVKSKTYAVLGNNLDQKTNGGAPVDAIFGNVKLGNTKTVLKLISRHPDKSGTFGAPPTFVELDKVEWDKTWKVKAGISLSLDPTQTTTTGNDGKTYWCRGQSVFGDGDLGSPGKANPSCEGWQDDDDNDGVPDKADNCKEEKNHFQTDSDKDGLGDACDNCPNKANKDQKDGNADGIGDLCEKVYCGNGVKDGTEACDDGNAIPGDGCSAGCNFETPLDAGAVVVTELMLDATAVTDSDGEWIELYNPGDKTVDLNGLELRTAKKVHVINAGLTKVPLAAKSYVAIAINTDKTKNGGVVAAYGYSAVSLNNSKGVVELWWGKTLVDQVSYANGAGGWQQFKTGRSQQLSADKLSAKANDEGSSWCKSKVSYGAGDFGSPGQPNVICPPDADGDEAPDSTDNCPKVANSNQADSDKDGIGNACDNCKAKANKDQKDEDKDGVGDVCTKLPESTCGDKLIELDEKCDDGNTVGGDGCSPVCTIEPAKIAAGALIITEFMSDSEKVSDSKGEWIEIYNPSDKDIDLEGFMLSDEVTVTAPLILADGKGVIVPAGDYVVLATEASKTLNGGLIAAYGWSGFGLNNGGDTIALMNPDGSVIDQITFSSGTNGWPKSASGRSYHLNPKHMSTTANDAGANWCLGTAVYGAGDKGTPGSPNVGCATTPSGICGNGKKETGEQCDDGNTKDGDGCTAKCEVEVVSAKQSGELVITEILFDPKAVSDSSGEWLELYNPSDKAIDITGWQLEDKDKGGVAIKPKTGTVTVPPKGFLVLAIKTDTAINGGVKAAYGYGSSIALTNSSSGGRIALLKADGTLVDEVKYQTTAGKLGWPGKISGSAIQLASKHMNATANDTGAAWCLASQTFGKGDKGTPGAANDKSCGAAAPPPPMDGPMPTWAPQAQRRDTTPQYRAESKIWAQIFWWRVQ